MARPQPTREAQDALRVPAAVHDEGLQPVLEAVRQVAAGLCDHPLRRAQIWEAVPDADERLPRWQSYVFALTYGPNVQWVKNVLAAGEAELEIRNKVIALERPELFVDPTRHLMSQPVRFFLGFARVTEFLRMWPAASD